MDRSLNIQQIKEIVSDLGRKYGAERIWLFGSYARGDFNSESDIDLRIDRGQIRGLAMGGLLNDLEEAFGRKVDLLSSKCLRKEFLDSIRNEEILLYEQQR